MVSILSVSMFMHSRFVVSFMFIGLICTFVRDWTFIISRKWHLVKSGALVCID